MPQHGKRYRELAQLVDRDPGLRARTRRWTCSRRPSKVNFDPSVEAHIRLGVDPRHADQMVRGTVVLPHGVGKTVRVLVFAQGDKGQEALKAGADEVGGEDLVKRIEAGWLEFDVALATPDMMGMVGKLGRILGRRGLMPNPKSGTITFDLDRAVSEVKAGRVEFKVDKGAIIHVPFGRASFEPQLLIENLASLVDAVSRARPSAAKGQYFKSLTVASTMGPGIRVDVPAVLARAVGLTAAGRSPRDPSAGSTGGRPTERSATDSVASEGSPGDAAPPTGATRPDGPDRNRRPDPASAGGRRRARRGRVDHRASARVVLRRSHGRSLRGTRSRDRRLTGARQERRHPCQPRPSGPRSRSWSTAFSRQPVRDRRRSPRPHGRRSGPGSAASCAARASATRSSRTGWARSPPSRRAGRSSCPCSRVPRRSPSAAR